MGHWLPLHKPPLVIVEMQFNCKEACEKKDSKKERRKPSTRCARIRVHFCIVFVMCAYFSLFHSLCAALCCCVCVSHIIGYLYECSSIELEVCSFVVFGECNTEKVKYERKKCLVSSSSTKHERTNGAEGKIHTHTNTYKNNEQKKWKNQQHKLLTYCY